MEAAATGAVCHITQKLIYLNIYFECLVPGWPPLPKCRYSLACMAEPVHAEIKQTDALYCGLQTCRLHGAFLVFSDTVHSY